jgi:hypothetical protein
MKVVSQGDMDNQWGFMGYLLVDYLLAEGVVKGRPRGIPGIAAHDKAKQGVEHNEIFFVHLGDALHAWQP